MYKDRHCLVIGGTKGIGRAVVVRMAQGGRVSVIARGLPSGVPTASGVLTDVPNTLYWAVDLRNPERLNIILDEIIVANGCLDSLVFLQRYRGDSEEWHGEIATTLTATMGVIDHLISTDAIKSHLAASIVMVGSIAGRLVVDDQPLGYHVVKAGLRQMVRYYAVKLGPQGIRVNSVSPGSVVKDENRAFYDGREDLLRLHDAITPLRRMGTAEEVASVIEFLCGVGASYITGQDIVVDGGVSLQWPEAVARRVMQ